MEAAGPQVRSCVRAGASQGQGCWVYYHFLWAPRGATSRSQRPTSTEPHLRIRSNPCREAVVHPLRHASGAEPSRRLVVVFVHVQHAQSTSSIAADLTSPAPGREAPSRDAPSRDACPRSRRSLDQGPRPNGKTHARIGHSGAEQDFQVQIHLVGHRPDQHGAPRAT